MASQEKTNVEVGVLFELTENPNALARLLAIHLAVECIKTGNSTYCPACASLQNSPVRLQVIPADTGTGKDSAQNKALQLFNTHRNLSGLIGPLSSANSERVAGVLGPREMSLISPSATSEALAEYKNFFRTTPSDTVVCKAIIELVVHLKYSEFVGLLEDATGGMSQGINLKMLNLYREYGVDYHPVLFDGLRMESAMAQLKTINHEVILAVGDTAENTFNIYRRLHQLRAGGQLTYRVLLGGDNVAGGNAPRFGDNTDYFEGVVSFKSSGGGERYEQFVRDWPALVGGLDERDRLLTVDEKFYPIDDDHLQTPPSYATESFEAAILFAKAAEIMLELNVNLQAALGILANKQDWYCLDRDPVKLVDRTRERTRVSIFRHTLPGAVTPSHAGNWTPASLEITGVDDLVNPAASPSQPATDKDNVLPVWVFGVIIASLGAVLIFACIAFVVCFWCQKRLPRRLRRDPPSLPGPGPPVVQSPRRPADPPRPLPKCQGCRAVVILGGGPEAILCAIVEAHMALTETDGNEAPTQVRLFTNEVKFGSNGLEYVDEERPWHVEVLHDSAKELLNTVVRAWIPTGLKTCWSESAESAEESVCVWRKTRNVLDTSVEHDLLDVLNRMLHEQKRRVNEAGDSALKFRLEREDYPKFQDLGARPSATAAELWERWSRHFFHPDIADAVVVTGEACCLGLAGKDRDRPKPADKEGLYSEYALRISVRVNGDHEQRQKYNAFLSLCSCRVFYNYYNYEPQSRRGTLILRITEEERKSLLFPANPNPNSIDCLGSDYSSVDVIWPTVPARSFDTLQQSLGIVSSYIKEYLHLFNLLPELVRRIECVKWTPAFMPNQVFLKGAKKTPVVLLGRSAYISDVLGRSFSSKIKGAFMAPIALRLFHRTKRQETSLARLESFLKLDRDDEMRFAKSMKACLPQYLDDVVTASGPEDRFSNQAAALQQAIFDGGAAEYTAKERDDLRETIVKSLAARCQQWQDLTRRRGQQDTDIDEELTSWDTNSPFRREAVTLEALWTLDQVFIKTSPAPGQNEGTKGLPRDYLRDDANTDVGVQNRFGIDPFGVHPAPGAARGVAAG